MSHLLSGATWLSVIWVGTRLKAGNLKPEGEEDKNQTHSTVCPLACWPWSGGPVSACHPQEARQVHAGLHFL